MLTNLCLPSVLKAHDTSCTMRTPIYLLVLQIWWLCKSWYHKLIDIKPQTLYDSFCVWTGLSLDIFKMESWTHMGRTANIIIKDVIHIFASISKIMRILLMGRRNRERWWKFLYNIHRMIYLTWLLLYSKPVDFLWLQEIFELWRSPDALHSWYM